MEYIVPLDFIDPPGIRDAIDRKIRQVKDFEEEIPAVFIVHFLPGFSVVYMSRRGLENLGVSLEEVRLTLAEYHSRYFNVDDAAVYVPKILGLLERNQDNEMVTYFQQVRPSEEHEWVWYLSSTRIFLRDEDGKPLLTLTMAVPIDSQSHITTKVERLMQENNFLQKYSHIFGSLTKREKEILALMALGKNSSEISEALHISETTALTHRRNIKSKINAQSNYDITRFAQAFDLI